MARDLGGEVEELQSSLALVCWWFLLFSLFSLVNAIQEAVHGAPGLYGLVALFRALLLSHSDTHNSSMRRTLSGQIDTRVVLAVE